MLTVFLDLRKTIGLCKCCELLQNCNQHNVIWIYALCKKWLFICALRSGLLKRFYTLKVAFCIVLLWMDGWYSNRCTTLLHILRWLHFFLFDCLYVVVWISSLSCVSHPFSSVDGSHSSGTGFESITYYNSRGEGRDYNQIFFFLWTFSWHCHRNQDENFLKYLTDPASRKAKPHCMKNMTIALKHIQISLDIGLKEHHPQVGRWKEQVDNNNNHFQFVWQGHWSTTKQWRKWTWC